MSQRNEEAVSVVGPNKMVTSVVQVCLPLLCSLPGFRMLCCGRGSPEIWKVKCRILRCWVLISGKLGSINVCSEIIRIQQLLVHAIVFAMGRNSVL